MLVLPVENQISLIKPRLQEERQLFSYYSKKKKKFFPPILPPAALVVAAKLQNASGKKHEDLLVLSDPEPLQPLRR